MDIEVDAFRKGKVAFEIGNPEGKGILVTVNDVQGKKLRQCTMTPKAKDTVVDCGNAPSNSLIKIYSADDPKARQFAYVGAMRVD